MSLLSQASLVVTPNGYKEGKLYSVIPSDGSGDMSVVRATTATRVNSAGLVELVPYNLLQQSNTFSTTWVNTSSTETGGQSGYDGSTNAWKIDITAAFGQIIQILPTSGYNTVSIYAKAGTLGFCRLRCDASVSAIADFDLSNGSLAYSFGIVSATSENVGNGWFRLQMYFNATATNLRIYPIVAANDLTATSGNIYIQDAQLNEGTLLPYQKTETRLNIPRLDYSNGTCPSLLVEPQRTNLVTYSEQMDNAAWTKLNGTVSANQAEAPDGTISADLFYPTTSGTDRLLAQTKTGTIGQTFTSSAFVKSSGVDWVLFYAANIGACWFNASTGVFGTVGSGVTASVLGQVNGFWRISLTATIANTNVYFYIGTANANGTNTITKNGTDGILVCGAQIELGSYATSYIPTTTASVTRNADVLTRAGFGNTSTSGTLFFDFYAENITSPNGLYILQLFAGSSLGNAFYVDNNGLAIIANGPSVQVYNNGYSQLVQSITPTQGQRVKVAIRYNGTNISSSINGIASSVLTDTSVGVKNALQINNGENSTHAFNAVAFFPSYLTNDELERLTGTGFNTYAEMANYYNYITQ